MLPSSNINEGIKTVLFYGRKKLRAKRFGTSKLVKVSSYIRTFTNLLSPSEYANLLVPQKQMGNSSVKQTKTKITVLNALKKHI